MAWFRKEKKPKEAVERQTNIPEGLWIKCEGCKEMLYRKEVEQNLNVCPKFGYHFRITARERFELLFDDNSYKEFAANIRSGDPLDFRDTKRYRDRLKVYEQRVGKGDAVLCAAGKLDGLSVIVCALAACGALVVVAGTAGTVVGAVAGADVGLAAPAGGLVGLAAGAVVGIGVLADVQPANSRIPHMALARRRSDISFILPGVAQLNSCNPVVQFWCMTRYT